MARARRPAAAPDPRARGRQAKQRRLDGADRQRARFPWLMPLIVILAVVVVVGGAAWAIALGHFF